MTRIAKQFLRLRVCEHDAALFVHNYDGIGRRLEQIAEFCFGAFAICDVANGARYKNAFLRFEWTEADLYRKFRSVLTPSVKLRACPHFTRLG